MHHRLRNLCLPVAPLIAAATVILSSAVHDAYAQSEYFPTSVADSPYWEQECAAAGDPTNTPCNGFVVAYNPEADTAAEADHHYLKSTMGPVFALPPGYMITRIEADVMTRNDDNGHSSRIDLRVKGPDGYDTGDHTASYTTHAGDINTHWRFNGTFILENASCRSAAWVNSLELWVRRSEELPVNRTRLRVRAFRLVIFIAPDFDGDCHADSDDNDDDNDGKPDLSDPNDFNPWICGDADGDGCDDCSQRGQYDPYHDGADFDGDGRCDYSDADLDNDNVANGDDPADYDRFACGDSDGDGCDDCAAEGQFAPQNDSCGTVTPFCFGDASLAPCPCVNTGSAGHGCNNSANTGGARLSWSGQAFVANDTLRFDVSSLPGGSSAMLYQGAAVTQQGYSYFGDGIQCISGQILRLDTGSASGSGALAFGYGVTGSAPISQLGQVTGGGTYRHYQVWYRNSPEFCTPAAFNLSNGLTARWGN